MIPLTLQIAGSIIYPKSNNVFNDGSVAVDIQPLAAAVGSRISRVQGPPNAALQTGPEHPLYRLPQSISSGGLKVHLNTYVPPKKSGIEKIDRRSSLSVIDEDHIIFEIAKSFLGDSGSEYKITNFQREDGEGSYGRGIVKFIPGWFSGGTWTIEYVYKNAGHAQESRVDLKVDEGGKEDGIWKMTFPMAGIVAKEKPQEEGAFGENGRSLDIMDGSPGLEGWSEAEWRDFLAACWITKVWNICTRTQWLGASIRSGEAGSLRTW
ncbi:hypothetical protein BDD12DRAFT_751707 [Trichophaea hybrida]|nr:hypothetical protein BDD12DRAFT_751707 [Trichophaea hybrida]